jgi:pimeloyl-ACP methyl ester carboxylesterase
MIDDAIPEARSLRTAAGHNVGYYEFGDPDGAPLVALHGTPASGAGFVWADTPAKARGLRLIAPDRPGIGLSDRVAHKGSPVVADYPSELFATLDALGIDEFMLLGYSGGGPFALAAAHAQRERIRGLTLVSCAGQVGEWASIDEFDHTDQLVTRLAQRAPALARALVSSSVRVTRLAPAMSARLAQIDMSATDRAVMEHFPSPRVALAVFTQAVLRGAAGVVDDYRALARPWGFPVEEVDLPTHLWHATDDVNVPLRHTESLSARLPHAALALWPGEGHLAVIPHAAEVLDGVVALANRSSY